MWILHFSSWVLMLFTFTLQLLMLFKTPTGGDLTTALVKISVDLQEGGRNIEGLETRLPSRGLYRMLPIHCFMSVIFPSSVSSGFRRSITWITIVKELKIAVNKIKNRLLKWSLYF